MDIPLPANAQALLAKHTGDRQPLLQLKPGQQLSATVAKISPDKQTLQLSIAGKKFSASFTETSLSNAQPSQLPITKGQVLKLIVQQLLPAPELKIQNTTVEQQASTNPQSPHLNQKQLNLISGLVLKIITQPQKSEAIQLNPLQLQHLQVGEKIPVKILQILPRQIQFELLPKHAENQTTVSLQQQNKSDAVIQPGKLLTLAIKSPAVAIKPGQTAFLEVLKPGSPPTFKISSLKTTDSSTDQVIFKAMKQFLPKQQSSSAMLNQLINELPDLTTQDKIPETLKNIARQIIQNLPQHSQLGNSKVLQQAINNSGTLLEAKLAAAPEPTATKSSMPTLDSDFKNNMLKLWQSLKSESSITSESRITIPETPVLKELLHKAETALARIVVDQLLSLPREESPRQIWHIELPFINNGQAETIKLTIEQDSSSDNPDNTNQWSVNITLTPPGLGTIHCKISYLDKTLSTHFRSEQQTTTELIQNHLQQLRTNFETAGMTTGHMDAQFQLSTAVSTTADMLGTNLLDENI